jgi:hypothetical protein
MRDSYKKAFPLVIGLEGRPSHDPDDPGLFTIFGLAKRFHSEVDENTTLEYAEKVYYEQYWVPQGCDEAPFPFDVCLFDSAVNPQNDPKLPFGGNKELMNLNPQSWQDYQLLRMERYSRRSKAKYVDGHIMRVVTLTSQIRRLMSGG